MGTNACFISYRREGGEWLATAVFQALQQKGVDAFLDVVSLGEGDFRDAIDGQIRQRPYFLLLLTPLSLVRCKERDDPVRQEIETAIGSKRRLVPLQTDKFDRTEINDHLPEILAQKVQYANTLTLLHAYFTDAMKRLADKFLVPVDVPQVSAEIDLTAKAETMVKEALRRPQIEPLVLEAQSHLETAVAAMRTNPALVEAELQAVQALLHRTTQPEIWLKENVLQVEQLTKLQLAMQKENLVFTSVSNVLKTRHEAAKAAIRNVR
jgi:TIR domain-containing protein